jgi:hypothetical protein
VIIAQPASQAVGLGTNASFSVTATGTQPLGYRWRFNGNNLTNSGQFSGVLTPSLTISNIQAANAGGYSVVVTNSLGASTSAVATLTVIAPLISVVTPSNLTWLTLLPNSHARLSLHSTADVSCRIQTSTDLYRWTTLTNVVVFSHTNQVIDLGLVEFPQRFYRAVWEP